MAIATDMPTVRRTATLPLREVHDVVAVRQEVRAWAQACGFSLVDMTKIVTAASELARNAVVHGGGGTATLEQLTRGDLVGLRLTFADDGPGIPDVGLALSDGFTTAGGLGKGLGGSRRLVNEFEIHSVPGEGTTVRIARWR